MFKVEIKKDEVLTHGTQFETQAECEAWYQDNLVAFPEGHVVSYEDVTAKLLADKQKSEGLSYLASTDWYVVRKAETGKEIPEEILKLRAEARLKI